MRLIGIQRHNLHKDMLTLKGIGFKDLPTA